jgi:hypothetical protein
MGFAREWGDGLFWDFWQWLKVYRHGGGFGWA